MSGTWKKVEILPKVGLVKTSNFILMQEKGLDSLQKNELRSLHSATESRASFFIRLES